MAWNATATKEARSDGSLIVNLIYTDGSRTVKESWEVSAGFDVGVRSKATIARLEAQDTAFAGIVNGPVTPKDPEPPIPPVISPEMAAKLKFLSDYETLKKMNVAVTLGFIPENDQAVIDQKALVTSEFKLEYLNLI